MPAAPRTPITPFRFGPDTLADLDALAVSLTAEEGKTISRAEVVRLLARRERTRREKAAKKIPAKSRNRD